MKKLIVSLFLFHLAISCSLKSGEDDFFFFNQASTATDNVTLLSENFKIPQLGRERSIWIYLPPDYPGTNQHFPVIYMQDGQDLFDEKITSSPTGAEWRVDESLNRLVENGDQGVIVVAIAHAQEDRTKEYLPFQNENGGGEGDAYVNFIIETLKPHIDANYRTLPGRENTAIMGSGLGAYISLYAAVKRQNVFGKAGIFSPSFWMNDAIFEFVKTTGIQSDLKIFMLAGQMEGNNIVSDLQKMKEILIGAGFEEGEDLYTVIHPDGFFAEEYWGREFPEVYQWLFN